MPTRLLLWPALAALAAGCGRLDYDVLDDGGPPPVVPDAAVNFPADASPADAAPPDAYAGDPADLWWNDAWGHRIELALDTSFAGEKLVDFPLPVFLDDSRIDTSKLQPDGADIRVIAGDNATELPHELELWIPPGDTDVASGLLWVKAPVLDPGDSSSRLWLYFDNPDASDAQRPAEVWTDHYAGVWHLNESSGLARADSTDKGNDLVASGSILGAYSELAGAIDLGSNPGALPLGRSHAEQDNLDPGAELTIEALINPASSGATMAIAGKTNSDVNRGYALKRLGDESIELLLSFDCTNMVTLISDELADAGRWHHIVAVYDGKAMRIYRNGTLNAERVLETGGAVCDGGDPFTIGSLPGGASAFNGLIDEVRISRQARSAASIRGQVFAMIDEVISYGDMEARP